MMTESGQGKEDDRVGIRTLWAILLALQIMVVAVGSIMTAISWLSSSRVQPIFTVERATSCVEEEKRYLSEGKPASIPVALLSHCAFLEKYVAVLEGNQKQLWRWLETGFVALVVLNLIFLLIEAVILKTARREKNNK